MTTTRQPIESHETHSKRLMEHAFEQLEKGGPASGFGEGVGRGCPRSQGYRKRAQ